MPLVADADTDGAHPDRVEHAARVAVVPVLRLVLLLCFGECAQLVVQRVLVLEMVWDGQPLVRRLAMIGDLLSIHRLLKLLDWI